MMNALLLLYSKLLHISRKNGIITIIDSTKMTMYMFIISIIEFKREKAKKIW